MCHMRQNESGAEKLWPPQNAEHPCVPAHAQIKFRLDMRTFRSENFNQRALFHRTNKQFGTNAPYATLAARTLALERERCNVHEMDKFVVRKLKSTSSSSTLTHNTDRQHKRRE